MDVRQSTSGRSILKENKKRRRASHRGRKKGRTKKINRTRRDDFGQMGKAFALLTGCRMQVKSMSDTVPLDTKRVKNRSKGKHLDWLTGKKNASPSAAKHTKPNITTKKQV
jgi:hypothetical protein